MFLFVFCEEISCEMFLFVFFKEISCQMFLPYFSGYKPWPSISRRQFLEE